MKRLREVRIARGIRVVEEAPKIGVQPQDWWRYERGDSEPSIEVACKIADLLGASLDELAGRTPTEASA